MEVELPPILIAFGALLAFPLAPRLWRWLCSLHAKIPHEDAEELKTW